MAKPSAKDTLPSLVDVRPLEPYERNTRTHSPEQIEQVKAAIRRFGFIGSLAYVPPAALKIGHARRQAAMEMWGAGEDVPTPGRRAVFPKWQLPAIDVTGLDDDELRALVIADNKLAENAGWDEDLLRSELEALGDVNFDLDSVGFDHSALEELMARGGGGSGGGGGGGDSMFTHSDQFGVIVMCKDEAEQEKIFNRLRDEGLNVKVVVV